MRPGNRALQRDARAQARARRIYAAWRAAGSPQRVYLAYEFDDSGAWHRVPVVRAGQLGWELASAEQMAAWAAWKQEREQLRGNDPGRE